MTSFLFNCVLQMVNEVGDNDKIQAVESSLPKEENIFAEPPKSSATVKGLSPRKHELISVLMVGFGFVFMMNGYDTSSFIAESVLHSVHERNPDQIDKYAGYYG